jgi:hypothetical protein
MAPIVLNEADLRKHVPELSLLHVKRDDSLSRIGDIVAELFSGALRLVSGEKHEILANPQNTSIVHHAHPAMGIRGRGEQNRGKNPRG